MPIPGQIVILNGAPRSGKSSIAAAIQETFEGVWMNLGVDTYIERITPPRYRPGIGLRPGSERPDIREHIPAFYAALYESIGAHSQLGLSVAADLGHQVATSEGLQILADCARRIAGLPVLLVGVHAPIDVVMERRRKAVTESGARYEIVGAGEPVPAHALNWQNAVQAPGLYDMQIDTSVTSPAEGADLIRHALTAGVVRPTAFERLAAAPERQ